jgi:hypothetical protein
MHGISLEDTKHLLKFDAVRQEVAAKHDLKNHDVVVEMSKVRITPELNLEVPNLGVFSMTDWSTKQLGTILGIQWKKWFNPEVVTAEQVQEELHRRFSKTGDQRKLRTSRFKPGSPGVPKCDGFLRAVLSPTYHPIDDERVFDRLEKKFGSRVEGLNFMKDSLNKKAAWGNDHCNYYTLVGAPISMGDIDRKHPSDEVRKWYDVAEREGRLPKEDTIYPGFRMRNSEVGFTAITIDEFSFRLVCLNGLMITVGDSRLMYRQHRPIEDDLLDRQLNGVFDKIPTRWESTRQNLTKLQEIQLEDAEAVIEDRLIKLEAPKHFREAAKKMWKENEPLPNMYGVVQAVTRAAQTYEDMDQRFEYEALAGKIVARA